MPTRPVTQILIVLVIVGSLMVAGAIAWVHYDYLPHMEAQSVPLPQSSMPSSTPIASPSSTIVHIATTSTSGISAPSSTPIADASSSPSLGTC